MNPPFYCHRWCKVFQQFGKSHSGIIHPHSRLGKLANIRRDDNGSSLGSCRFFQMRRHGKGNVAAAGLFNIGNSSYFDSFVSHNAAAD